MLWNQIRINDSIICFLLPFDTEKNIVLRNKCIILKQVSWSMEDGRTEEDHLKLCFHFSPKGHKPELLPTVKKFQQKMSAELFPVLMYPSHTCGTIRTWTVTSYMFAEHRSFELGGLYTKFLSDQPYSHMEHFCLLRLVLAWVRITTEPESATPNSFIRMLLKRLTQILSIGNFFWWTYFELFIFLVWNIQDFKKTSMAPYAAYFFSCSLKYLTTDILIWEEN